MAKFHFAKICCGFGPFKAVFQRKAHLKPPNYPYYLFPFLNRKLPMALGAVIERVFSDALARLVILTSGVGEEGA